MKELKLICDDKNRIHERIMLKNGSIISKISHNKLVPNSSEIIVEFALNHELISREEYYELIEKERQV